MRTWGGSAPRASVYLLALLGVSLTLNVILGIRLNARRVVAPRVLEGLHVRPFWAEGVGGRSVRVDWDAGRPTVLYYVDPKCSWCVRNASSFRSLVTARHEGYRFIVVSSSRPGGGALLCEAVAKVLCVTDASGALVRQVGLYGTPQTLVISPAGVVVKHWAGAYTGATKALVEQYFGVSLNDPAESGAASGNGM